MIELLKKIDKEGIVVEVVEGELKLFSSKQNSPIYTKRKNDAALAFHLLI